MKTIKASKCSSCNRVVSPPRNICPFCGFKAGICSIIELSNKGQIISHTIVNMPPEGFTNPVRLALVQLEKEALVICLNNEIDKHLEIGDYVEIALYEEDRFVISSVK